MKNAKTGPPRRIILKFHSSHYNLEKAVGTTDDTDDMDEAEVALERAFTQRVSAEEGPANRESGPDPCDPCHPWFLKCRI